MKPSKDLDEQIDEITQTAFIALSEWQAGLPVDWNSAKLKCRAELRELVEQREREASIDELKGFMATMVVTHGNEPARSVSTAKIRERIKALKASK